MSLRALYTEKSNNMAVLELLVASVAAIAALSAAPFAVITGDRSADVDVEVEVVNDDDQDDVEAACAAETRKRTRASLTVEQKKWLCAYAAQEQSGARLHGVDDMLVE